MKDGRDILEQLRREYAHHLPEKLGRLRALLDRLWKEPNDPEVLAELGMALHKLKGSAGTHGLMEVSRIAGQWERAVSGEGEGTPRELPQGSQMAAWLEALGRAAETEIPADPPPPAPGLEPCAEPIPLVDDDEDLRELSLYAARKTD